MSEKELFSRQYPVAAQPLLDALQRALASMPTITLQRVSGDGRSVEFQTTFTLTSWGDNMVATVEEVDDSAAVLRVSGKPRVGMMSTPWGEELHATQIEQQLFAALDTTLAAGAAAASASGSGAGNGHAASKRARDIMTAGVEVIDMDATVADAAVRLAASDIGVLPICNSKRRLQGMVTDRDIVVKVIARGKDPSATKISEVAQGTEVVTIGADDSLDEALQTMKRHKVRRLPVIDGTDLVGIISQGDLAKNLPDDRVGDLVEVISAAP